MDEEELELIEKYREENLINMQMMFDELYAEKDSLEKQCIEIENQISNNTVSQSKNFEWEIKAQNALKIKKHQLKKVNRKIELEKHKNANNRRKTQIINDLIKKRLIEEIGEENFNKFLNELKEKIW